MPSVYFVPVTRTAVASAADDATETVATREFGLALKTKAIQQLDEEERKVAERKKVRHDDDVVICYQKHHHWNDRRPFLDYYLFV